MNKEELNKTSTEALKKKLASTNALIGIFVPIILGLAYFLVRDYWRGEGVDMAILTIIICSIGGMVSLFPQRKAMKEELMKRE